MGLLRCWSGGSHPELLSVVSPQSLDSWGTSEDADAPSKRHSASDLSDTASSDIRREGWLSYKQVLTKKGKVRWAEERRGAGGRGSAAAVPALRPPEGCSDSRAGVRSDHAVFGIPASLSWRVTPKEAPSSPRGARAREVSEVQPL